MTTGTSGLTETEATITPRQVRAVLTGTMLAMFLAALDSTIVATALPPIARDLGGFALISWVMTAYLLTSTCATPILGKLSDLYGRRSMVLACLVLFMVASALCALAPGMIALIAARALQGIGGGGLLTLAQAVIGDVVPPRERGRYAGYFSVMWATASVAGPTLGGLLTEHFGWPWIFWINLPLGVVALVISERALRILPRPRARSRLDLASIALLAVSTVALLMLLSLGGKSLAWTDPEALALGVAAVVLGVAFAHRQMTSAEPILPPRFLRDGVLRPMLAASFIVYGGYLAIVVIAPIYLQLALGTSVSAAGLLLIPLMLASTVTANLAGRMTARFGYIRPQLLGLPFAVLGSAALALLADRLTAVEASALLAVVGFGLGPTFPCSTVACQNAVEQRDLGAVSGALTFARALGGSILIAAASALVLGLAAAALPATGTVASLEDLARQQVPPAALAAVAHAFAVTFGAAAAALALAWGVMTRVEARPLRGRVGA